jgi:hypothetical protein
MSTPLITTDDYAAAMAAANINVPAAALTFLPTLIDQATDAIETYCRREFGQQTITDLYDGDHTVSLILRLFPVASITSITVYADTDSPQVLDASTYRVNPRTGEVRLTNHFAGSTWEAWGASGVFPEGWQNIEVVYVAGYADVPAAVKLACIQTVKAALDSFRRDSNVDGERWEDYSWFRNTQRKDVAIPETAKDLLAPHRDYRA